MNVLEWIMAAGVTFGAGLFFLAVFSSDPWDDHGYDNTPPIMANAPSPHPDERSRMTCSSCHEILGATPETKANNVAVVPPIVRGAPSPHPDGRSRQVCANCHRILSRKEALALGLVNKPNTVTALPVAQTVITPLKGGLQPPPSPSLSDPEAHERFFPSHFQGHISWIVDLAASPQGNTVKIQVNNGYAAPLWVDLAPAWYLKAKKCSVRKGLFVKGQTFKERGRTQQDMLYGMSLSVNGAFCQLRDSHMIGLWEGGSMDEQDEE